MNKRILAATLSAALAVTTLASCSAAPADDVDADSGTLRLIAITSQQKGTEAVIAAFKKEYPEIDVVAEFLAGDNIITTVRTQLTAGNAPDILPVTPGAGGAVSLRVLSEAGHLADLSDEPWVSTIPESLLPNAKDAEGRVVAFQGAVGGFAAIYNNEALAEVGLEIPRTWSDLMTFCADARAAGRFAYSQGILEPVLSYFPVYVMQPEIVYGAHADFDQKMASGEMTYADSPWRDLLTQYIDMVDAGCFNDDFAAVDNSVMQERWAKGEALGALTHGGDTLNASRYNPDVTFSLAPFPSDDDPNDDWLTITQSYGFAVNERGQQALAKKFMSFLATPEINTLFVNSQTDSPEKGIMPLLIDEASWTPSQFSDVWTEYIEAGRVYKSPGDVFPNPEILRSLSSGLQEALVHRRSVDELLAGMQKAYDEG